MDLDEYVKSLNIKVTEFCKSVGIDQTSLYYYRKRDMRPAYNHAMHIVEFSKGIITFNDLGWEKSGEKIPWTKNDLKNSVLSNGSKICHTVPPDPVDPIPQKCGSMVQPEEQPETEGHNIHKSEKCMEVSGGVEGGHVILPGDTANGIEEETTRTG